MSFVVSLLMALVSVILGSIAVTRLMNAAINIRQSLPSPDSDILLFLSEVSRNFVIWIVMFVIAVMIMKRLSKGWLGVVVIFIMLAGIYSILGQFGFVPVI
jgi:hypothetical protein